MKKLFCIFAVLSVISPAFAEGEIDKTTVAATASYVDGAYNTMDAAKQDKLTNTNVVESGTGPIVSSVTASNGTVTVTKSEVTIPVVYAENLSHFVIFFYLLRNTGIGF